MATDNHQGLPSPAERMEVASKLDVWSIFTPTAMPAGAINLGQGFMNWAPPSFVTEAACEALQNDVSASHYSHPRGRPALRKAVADHYSDSFERKLNPEENILVSAGANLGMFAFLTAFINPGDEVV